MLFSSYLSKQLIQVHSYKLIIMLRKNLLFLLVDSIAMSMLDQPL
jgi:hypothetical protein